MSSLLDGQWLLPLLEIIQSHQQAPNLLTWQLHSLEPTPFMILWCRFWLTQQLLINTEGWWKGCMPLEYSCLLLSQWEPMQSPTESRGLMNPKQLNNSSPKMAGRWSSSEPSSWFTCWQPDQNTALLWGNLSPYSQTTFSSSVSYWTNPPHHNPITASISSRIRLLLLPVRQRLKSSHNNLNKWKCDRIYLYLFHPNRRAHQMPLFQITWWGGLHAGEECSCCQIGRQLLCGGRLKSIRTNRIC